MSFAAVGIASAGSSLIGSIFKGIQARKQQKMANAINPVNAVYEKSPYAENQLATVQQMMNGRMAGAASEQNNIFNNMANSMGSVGRNSTSGAQSLAMLGGLQGNTNQALSQLQQKENMNSQSLLGYLSSANQGMTQENQNVYQDQLRNYNNDLNAKNALQNASWQNKGGMVDGFQNALMGVGNMASQGVFNGLGGQPKPTALIQGSSVPQVGNYVQSGQLNGGMYIDPLRQNPQMNYSNPFIR